MKTPGGLVLAWCALYTSAAPEHERDRRREEIRSHVWETFDARGVGWTTRARVAAACIRGALSDLAWCDEVRREAGSIPLLPAVLIGPTGSTFIAGVMIVTAFGLSTLPVDNALRNEVPRVIALLSAAVMTVSLTYRAFQRWSRRRAS